MSRLTLLETYEVLRETADERLSARVAAHPHHGAEITCRAGCSACCRQLVVVSPLEAHAISAHVDAKPELRERIASRHSIWRTRVVMDPDLDAKLTAFTAGDGYVSGDDGGALELSYWRPQLPCPFLDGDHCGIYPVRPFACREHHVTSDPALCSQNPDAATPADTRLEYRAVASFVGSRAYGLPDRLIPLPHALPYARDHAGEADAAAEETDVRWAVETGQRQARRALALIMLSQRNR